MCICVCQCVCAYALVFYVIICAVCVLVQMRVCVSLVSKLIYELVSVLYMCSGRMFMCTYLCLHCISVRLCDYTCTSENELKLYCRQYGIL